MKSSSSWQDIAKLFNNTYFLIGVLLLPLILVSPLTNVFFEECEIDINCFESLASNNLEKPQIVTSEGGEIANRVGAGRIRYPSLAFATGSEADFFASYNIDENGKASDIIIRATTSNLKRSFEEAMRRYMETWRFEIPEDASYSFPLKGFEVEIPFRRHPDLAEDKQRVNPSTILSSVLVYVLLSIVLVKGSVSQLLIWLRDTSIPFGAILGLYFINDAIFLGITTDFFYISTAVLIFSIFGFVAVISTFYASDQCYLHKLSNFQIFLIPFTLLTWHFFMQEGNNLNGLISLFELFGWIPKEVDGYERMYVYDAIKETWHETTSRNFSATSLIIFIVIFIAAIFQFIREPDLSVFPLAALFTGGIAIGLTMFLWFQNFTIIQEDYVNLLEIAHIGSSSLMLVAIALLSVHILSVNKQRTAIANWRRINFYLIELMTFFLFFVYAPVSISELGINFDEDQKTEDRMQSLENDIKELKETLKQNNLKLSPTEN